MAGPIDALSAQPRPEPFPVALAGLRAHLALLDEIARAGGNPLAPGALARELRRLASNVVGLCGEDGWPVRVDGGDLVARDPAGASPDPELGPVARISFALSLHRLARPGHGELRLEGRRVGELRPTGRGSGCYLMGDGEGTPRALLRLLGVHWADEVAAFRAIAQALETDRAPSPPPILQDAVLRW